MASSSRWFMIDGKLNPRALVALYATGMAEEVIAVLHGTPYEAIAASGPILARASSQSELQRKWHSNEVPVCHAWCFTTELTAYDLAAYWRRRLLVNGPMGRTLWLRYSDARVMARGVEKAVFSTSFWKGVSSLQLSPQHGEWMPRLKTEEGQADSKEPQSDVLLPLFTFNEHQLATLSAPEYVA